MTIFCSKGGLFGNCILTDNIICKMRLTLSLIRALAPALMRDCVEATSPASAAKKSAVQPVLCGEREEDTSTTPEDRVN